MIRIDRERESRKSMLSARFHDEDDIYFREKYAMLKIKPGKIMLLIHNEDAHHVLFCFLFFFVQHK